MVVPKVDTRRWWLQKNCAGWFLVTTLCSAVYSKISIWEEKEKKEVKKKWQHRVLNTYRGGGGGGG